MDREVELLKECIETRSPVLLLGAGFSLDARGKTGKKLMLGKGLCQELFNSVVQPNRASISDEDYEDAQFYHRRGKLKELCDVIRKNNLIEERNRLFQDLLSKCSFADADYYSLLTKHAWSYIFTLNVDDLVENIFAQEGKPLNRWLLNSSSFREDPSRTLLVKLHGDVYDPATYVFDSNEYRKFSGADSWMLRKFSDLYVCHDLIILGTQFQEEDLEIALQKAFEYGCDNSNFHYFFISPGTISTTIADKIKSRSYFHHIQWDTKTFLSFIDTEIIEPKESLHLLTSQGVVYWNDEMKKASAKREDWELYHGNIPEPKDFYYSVDIRRKKESSQFEPFISENSFGIIELRGKTYVGKTCFVKRALSIGVEQGYLCFYLSRTDLQSIRLIDYYLSTSTINDISLIICFENASYCYRPLIAMAQKHNNKFNKLFFIVTTNDTTKTGSNSYLFQPFPFVEIEMTEHIDRRFAKSIYDKLNEKNQLGRLLHYADRPRDIQRFIKEKDDFIDVLYIAHHGRSFADFFNDWLQIKEGSIYYPVFQAIALIVSTGVPCVSISALPDISRSLGQLTFDFNYFIDEFDEFCFNDHGLLYLRCARLFNDIIIKKIDVHKKQTVVKNLISEFSRGLIEREYSPRNDLFQHLSRASSLLSIMGFNNHDALDLLISLKEDCKHLSYYWIQLGILYRNEDQYEDAENAFFYAQEARGNETYQISHATAKNYMEWGVWAISNSPTQAKSIFDEGSTEMMKLIWRWRYPDAICFSAHAYINMNIKFYSQLDTCPGISTWDSMITLLEQYIRNSNYVDHFLENSLKDMTDFASKYGLPFSRKDEFHEDIQRIKHIHTIGSDYYNCIDSLPTYDK